MVAWYGALGVSTLGQAGGTGHGSESRTELGVSCLCELAGDRNGALTANSPPTVSHFTAQAELSPLKVNSFPI